MPFNLRPGIPLSEWFPLGQARDVLLREPAHRGAVALGRRQDDLAAGFGGANPVVPSGCGRTRGQPLEEHHCTVMASPQGGEYGIPCPAGS